MPLRPEVPHTAPPPICSLFGSGLTLDAPLRRAVPHEHLYVSRARAALTATTAPTKSYRELDVFAKASNNTLNHVAQFTIVCAYGAALIVTTGLSQGLNPVGFGVVLVRVAVQPMPTAGSMCTYFVLLRSSTSTSGVVGSEGSM